MTKHRIEPLTSIRAIAALLVVVFHYGCEVFPFDLQEHFFRRGNLAVGFFFVLSGFVMYLSYHNRQFAYGDYLKRRLARIWPLFVFALIVSLSWPFRNYLIYHQPLNLRYNAKAILLNLGLLQAYVPGYALSGNSPGWSLSIEFSFYLLFPALLWAAEKYKSSFIKAALAFFVLSQTAHLLLLYYVHPAYPSVMHEFIYYNPIFHFNQFLIGICGGYYLNSFKKNVSWLWPTILGAVIILLINYLPGYISLHNGLLAPLFVMLLILLAKTKKSLLECAPLIFLGEISYGIYILQEPLHFYWGIVNVHYLHLKDASFFYSYLIVLIVAATACYYTIELPCKKLILKR